MLDEPDRVAVVLAVAVVAGVDDVLEFDLVAVGDEVFERIVCWPIEAIDDMPAICIALSSEPKLESLRAQAGSTLLRAKRTLAVRSSGCERSFHSYLGAAARNFSVREKRIEYEGLLRWQGNY